MHTAARTKATGARHEVPARASVVRLAFLLVVLTPASLAGQEVPAVLSLPEAQGASPVQIATDDVDPGYAITDVRAASFQEVTPGQTTLEQLREAMGEPQSETSGEGLRTLTYKVGPFPKVEMIVAGDVLVSVVIHLSEPANPEAVAAELNVAKFTPSPVVDARGKLLGRVYPERALVFSYAATTPPRVSQIILEPIASEPFMLRVESDRAHRFRRQLADLRFVRKLDPNHARACWLEAEILARMGQTADAVQLIETACRVEPENVDFALARAEHLMRVGRIDEARQTAAGVAEAGDETGRQSARADLILGDAALTGVKPDYKASMEHYMATINGVAQLTNDPRVAVRLESKRLLIDAYLAVAVNIGRGDWNRKAEMVPRWLSNAEAVIDDMIQNEGSDPALRLLLYRRTLEAYAAMQGAIDPNPVADAALTLGRQLIAAADDPDYQHVLQWELAAAIAHAAHVLHARGKAMESSRMASVAMSLFQGGVATRGQDALSSYELGTTMFLIGAVEAVARQNHAEAAAWFDKAAVLLEVPLPAQRESEMGMQGERLVSMGVSYWNTGQRDKALNLTQRGSALMERAVAAGQLGHAALAIPYGNLSSMHGELGNAAEARLLAEKAAAAATRR